MRLKSSMWFTVFMRLERERGAFVSVVKSGSQEAGALFVIQNHLNGTLDLHAPAPQSITGEIDERKFECVLEKVDQSEIDAYLERQIKFDPDLWVIETESGAGDLKLDIG